MSDARTVTFYLHDALRRRAEAGQHNFISRVSSVLTSSGLTVAFDDDSDRAELKALARPGYGIFHMRAPLTGRQIVMRRTYIYPFWHLEAQAERWDWPVARDPYGPAEAEPAESGDFYRYWQKRLFNDAPQAARRKGIIYVPLQGRLTEHRSFQSCSPLEMVARTAERAEGRRVVVTLHPRIAYERSEIKALRNLVAATPGVEIGNGGMEGYLRDCDMVVTQNSAVGLMGYFFGKPLILFGRIDFHHIALKVSELGLDAAFAAAPDHAPDYASYIFWFLQRRSINAGRPDCEERIRLVLRGHGWPV